MKNSIACMCLLLSFCFMQAQQSSPNGQDEIALPTIIPPAPTVANLMQFEEVPVDHYSGQANISIPLGSVGMLDGMSYPIGIHYNTLGVRVDERSGWLGTGFSMPTGGVISRTIRGIPDELNLTDSGIGIFHNDYEYFSTFSPAQRAEFLWKTANGNTRYDADHDIYQYNFFGKGGRFIIKKQSNQLIPVIIGDETNDKITVFYNTSTFEVTGFEVTDTNGYVYTFEEFNFNLITSNTTTTSQYGNSSNTSTDFTNADNVPNAWYLKEVKQPSGTVLCSFVYQDVEENYHTPTSTVYNRLVNQNINFGNSQVININRGMLLPREVTSSQYIQSTQKYVKEVLFYDGTKVEYILDANGHPEYNTLNLPINTTTKSGTKLKTIIVTTPNGTEHKRINFFYQTTSNNRLFLTKIDEVFGVETLTYLLDYNDKNTLAGFGSDLKDTYGYFNNGPNTNAFIRAKRWVNPDKITTGVLSSITYPTGGKKEFTFESNTYSYEGATPIDPETIPENIIGQSRVATLTGSATITASPEKVLLYIDRGQLININTVINSIGAEAILNNHKIFLSKVQPISGTVNPPAITNGSLNYSPYSVSQFEYVSSGFAYEFNIQESTLESSIASGWYVIEMKTIQPYLTPNGNDALSVTPTISYSTFDLKTRIKYGGGIRIKEVLFTDQGQEQKKILYNYQDDPFADPSTFTLAGTDTSSGSFEVDRASIRYTKKKIHPFLNGYICAGIHSSAATIQTNTRTLQTATYEITRDINQVLTPITKGNYIGYKKVYVRQEGNGGELFTFISPRDIQILTPANSVYPFKPLENNDYKRGMLEKHEIFDESKNILVKQEYDYIDVSNVVHTSNFPYEVQDWDCPWDSFYNYYEHFSQGNNSIDNYLNLCSSDDVNEPDVSTCFGSNPDMTYDPYHHIRGIKLPSEVIKTAYFYEGTTVSETVTTTKTLYNTKNRVKEKTTEFLEGGITTIYKEETRYPYSYESSEYTTAEQTVLNAMVAENIIESPVQNKQYKNGTLIYDTQRIFEEFHPNVFKVSEIKSAKANTVKQSRVKFHTYNTLGQPLELSQTDGTRISYVWGYDNMYPIAKLENTSYTDVSMPITSAQQTAIDNAVLASNADMDATTEETLQTALEDLRVKFPNAMVTTLTYDPIIGVTRTNDPRGYTSYFEYDALHRLKQVKDADKNILSANEYFYKNTNSSLDNYVKSIIYTQATQDGLNIANWNKVESINYADGLGRAKQAIGIRQGGTGEDIVTAFDYDDLGRQTKEFLPYATTSLNGSIHNSVFVEQAAFYNTLKYENTTNPYSEKSLEKSPLARVLEQGAPGSAWLLDAESDNDHTIKMDYQTNSYNGVFADMDYDNVKRFNVSYGVNGFTDVTLQESGYYQAGELYKSIVKDENWQPNQTHENDHTIEEFKDKLGRVVLKRTYNTGERHDTYYVYDDFGNLSYVLPPLVDLSNGIITSELTELCYQYKYDHRNRLIEKKLPAKEAEYIVYDKLDRPVLTQDPNLRADDKWLFTKYDVFGRVTYTGIVINSGDRVALQAILDNTNTHESKTATATTIGNTSVYYTNGNYPNDASVIVLNVNYYDNYNWDTQNSLEADYSVTLLGIAENTSGTILTKTLPSGWTNAGFLTNGTIQGDGYLQYTITQTDKRAMVGLSPLSSADIDDHSSIKYKIYTGYSTDNRIAVYKNGILQTFPATYCQVGDTFKVERVGTQILFKKNNEIFYSVSADYSGSLVGSGVLIDNGTALENVHVGYAVYGQAFTANAKGLPTGSKVRTIGTNHWTTSESYYDEKARMIFGTSKNEYLDTQDAVSTLLDFTGKPLETRTTHTRASGSPIVTIDNYVYDENARLLYQTKQINGGNKELIARNHYDALGQLEMKQVGGALPNISAYSNLVNVNVNGNIISKTGVNAAWDASLTTDATITGDGYLSYEISQSNKPIIVGLSETVGNSSFSSINYAIYSTSWGTLRIYEGGIYKGEITTYFAGDKLAIERRGAKIYYLKNGEIFYVSGVPDGGNPLLGDISIYSTGAQIKDLVLVDLEKELQEVDFTYNVRGWLKGINDINNQGNDLFSFALKYNDIADQSKQLFNGNISSTLWKTKGQDGSLKNYVYEYDALNRITKAVDNTGNYNLDNVDYDQNGNITNLFRTGHRDANATTFGTMDDLYYTYQGNQLMKVKDDSNIDFGFKDGINTGDDYDYDDNGNMIFDKNKGISTITYNYLNLPEQITFDNGSKISYIYDATGVKLEKKLNDPSGLTQTFYAGNYVYTQRITFGQSSVALTFFNSEEGYIEPQFDPQKPKKIIGYNYTYQYKDHLGNIRLSYEDMNDDGVISPETEIKEENHYYPFGLKHKGYNANQVGRDHNYGYNGIEESDELGLNVLEMDMRQYDPAIARWTVIDPVTHHDYSPYQAFDNNPVFWADPSGADATDPIEETNTVISSWVDKSNTTHITQTTITTTTTTNDDGSVSITYSSGSITNTVDAYGKVTNGTTQTTTSGVITKDAKGNVSATDPTTTTSNVSSSANSALNEWTNTVADYNKNNDGVYNKDKINELSDKTIKATKVGAAVLGVFAGMDKLIFGKLGPNSKKAFNLIGGITTSDGVVGKTGEMLKNSIGKNNEYMMIYGIEQVRNGVTFKKMKTPSKPDGNRSSVGPTSWQDLFNPDKTLIGRWFFGGKKRN